MIAIDPSWLATVAIVALTAAHCSTHRHSGGTQTGFTILKLLLIVAFSVAALALSPAEQQVTFFWRSEDAALLTSGAFAVSLIYVNYAYSGWNAATYISGELASPSTESALGAGYQHNPGGSAVLPAQLCIPVGSADRCDGWQGRSWGDCCQLCIWPSLGTFMGLLLALLLISTISAMILAGPRVLHRIGQDYPRFAALARENADGIPVTAIVLQSATALLFLWSASFEQILVFSGATMALNTFATVLGLFILRWRQPHLLRPFRVTLYPITPLIFLGITGWTLTYVVLQRPVEALISAAIVASGGVFYWLVRPTKRPHL